MNTTELTESLAKRRKVNADKLSLFALSVLMSSNAEEEKSSAQKQLASLPLPDSSRVMGECRTMQMPNSSETVRKKCVVSFHSLHCMMVFSVLTFSLKNWIPIATAVHSLHLQSLYVFEGPNRNDGIRRKRSQHDWDAMPTAAGWMQFRESILFSHPHPV